MCAESFPIVYNFQYTSDSLSPAHSLLLRPFCQCRRHIIEQKRGGIGSWLLVMERVPEITETPLCGLVVQEVIIGDEVRILVVQEDREQILVNREDLFPIHLNAFNGKTIIY